MAAARVRQAARHLASAVAPAASAAEQGGSSAGSRAGFQWGRTAAQAVAATTAVAACAYDGTERHLMETVPYPDGAPDGGRVRGPKPLWAALLGGWRPQSLGPATTTFVVEQGVPEAVKWVSSASVRLLA